MANEQEGFIEISGHQVPMKCWAVGKQLEVAFKDIPEDQMSMKHKLALTFYYGMKEVQREQYPASYFVEITRQLDDIADRIRQMSRKTS